MEALSQHKALLLGGAGVAALLAYLYFSGSAGASSGDSGGGMLPTSIVYGVSGNPASSMASASTDNTGNGISSADAALIDLQNSQLQLQHSVIDHNFDLSFLNATNAHEENLLSIKNDYNKAQLDTITTGYKDVIAHNSGATGLIASVNGETIGVSVAPGSTMIPPHTPGLFESLFGSH